MWISALNNLSKPNSQYTFFIPVVGQRNRKPEASSIQWTVHDCTSNTSSFLHRLFHVELPMTWTCVLAVMLVATLVATHSHSPWSSFVSDLNCRLPRGRTLCLLLLGFPTCRPTQPEKHRTIETEGRERERWRDSKKRLKDTAGTVWGINLQFYICNNNIDLNITFDYNISQKGGGLNNSKSTCFTIKPTIERI